MTQTQADLPFSFAFSLCHGTVDQGDIGLALKETVFSAVEISGGQFEEEDFCQTIQDYNLAICHVRDLLPASLTRTIAQQNDKIIAHFQEQYELLLSRSIEQELPGFSLDFALENFLPDAERRSRLAGFLKRLAPLLHDRRITLCLPLRIPSPTSVAVESYPAFLQQLMTSSYQLSADIHPHELDRESGPEDILRWIRFNLGIVRFIYDADAGNYLVERLLKPWLDLLGTANYRGAVVFVPRIRDAEQYFNEITRLNDLLVTLSA